MNISLLLPSSTEGHAFDQLSHWTHQYKCTNNLLIKFNDIESEEGDFSVKNTFFFTCEFTNIWLHYLYFIKKFLMTVEKDQKGKD